MRILIISPDYPDDGRPTFPFVKQLADEMARQGHSIQVIAPYSLSHNKKFVKKVSSYPVGESRVFVYRPYFISLSNIRIKGRSLSELIKQRAFSRGFRMLREKPDVVYGHFWDSAYKGYKYAVANNLPLFVATGESEIDFRKDSLEKQSFCDYVSGVICVSTKNKEESLRLSLTVEEKCKVTPNAIDSSLFRKLDKTKCRKELGFPQNAFIVAFVGWFNERKGSVRVATAIKMLADTGTPVYSFFIGQGEAEPVCDNILFKGKLPHNEIPKYLNTADVFVLPTLQEGCCNAVIEAMACGLPVISSNLPFNWDVLNETNSLMIDPRKVIQISGAIKLMRDNPQRRAELSVGALTSAQGLTIERRAETILGFLSKQSI